MEISMYLAAKHMARYMEISMYLSALHKARYMEISMYLAMTHMARYMKISIYLLQHIRQGAWKFPCAFYNTYGKVHGNFHVTCGLCEAERYMEISKYLAICLAATLPYVKLKGTWKFPCTLQRNMARYGNFYVPYHIFRYKVHGNFHVPCHMFHCKIHGNFHVPCHYIFRCKIHGNFHVPCHMFHRKVHGNFHVPCHMFISLQDTWKFPSTLPNV